METVGWIFGRLFYWINRKIYWYQLPSPLAFLNLIALRTNLRAKNLFDTTTVPPHAPPADSFGFDVRCFRTPDGSYNDLSCPAMGMKGTRFGRNVGIEHTWPNREQLMDPSPRVVSRRLLRRESFQPATSLNILAAAWIQFQVHDWFTHGKDSQRAPICIPLDPAGDDWPLPTLETPATTADSTAGPADQDRPPTFLCDDTHWWDASSLYGGPEKQKERRTAGGKFKLTADGLLPLDENGLDLTGVNNNWWIGLAVMHTIFTREHNAVCDMLAAAHPDWPDDRLFHTARLIITALIAKIHTIEWTPTLLDTPILRIGMRGNWWGLLGEWVRKRIGRLTPGDILSGIMGSKTNHHGTPYSMTEEFVAVYRMHPLIPDDFVFRDAHTGEILKTYTLTQLCSSHCRPAIEEVGFDNVVYHMATEHPGALRLHNYPRCLQDLVRQDGEGRTDLASVEILRDRERGIPRYNDFRELLDMPRIKRFADLSDDPVLAKEIETVYDGDLDKVDTLVGLLAETPPPGFAFSDTAFRIFILMASRRLKSDRFFTTDFTPEIYSKEGMKWVMDTTFADVLRRHFPDFASALPPTKSPFTPWGKLAQ